MTTDFTPWARNGILGSGLRMADLAKRVPAGWTLRGSARSGRGPYTLALVRGGESHAVSALSWTVIPDALDRLFAKVGVEA